ncbi:MAG: hypothetical protein COA42_19520 [Alteromonadaceae bacterium]|nr:MAG: hypothetical protein COA42_19520 [Alteromonadaceae bacterium]
MSNSLEQEIIELIRSGKKVAAIKELCRLRGISLKEAKYLVDEYSKSSNVTTESKQKIYGESKFISLFISNTKFTFTFILLFLVVIYMAIFSEYGGYWQEAAWSMLSLLGIMITITAFFTLKEGLDSKHWPRHEAKLLSAGVSTMSSDGRTSYKPEVTYEFVYEGEQYKGTTFNYSESYGAKGWAQKQIDEIKERSPLTVSVNPSNLAFNVIDPGIRLVHVLRFLIGPGLIVVGLLSLFEMIPYAWM